MPTGYTTRQTLVDIAAKIENEIDVLDAVMSDDLFKTINVLVQCSDNINDEIIRLDYDHTKGLTGAKSI